MSVYASLAEQLRRAWSAREAAREAGRRDLEQRTPHSMRAQALRQARAPRQADGTLQDWGGLFEEPRP